MQQAQHTIGAVFGDAARPIVRQADVKHRSQYAVLQGAQIITCGARCQPTSGAGQGRGTADSRDLLHTLHDILSAVNPEYMVIELVPGAAKLPGLVQAIISAGDLL
eukprot:6044587-Alexandrium_andersonii.AAC.1